jgi:hypothetical protein
MVDGHSRNVAFYGCFGWPTFWIIYHTKRLERMFFVGWFGFLLSPVQTLRPEWVAPVRDLQFLGITVQACVAQAEGVSARTLKEIEMVSSAMRDGATAKRGSATYFQVCFRAFWQLRWRSHKHRTISIVWSSSCFPKLRAVARMLLKSSGSS